jgi:hypothetical protein
MTGFARWLIDRTCRAPKTTPDAPRGKAGAGSYPRRVRLSASEDANRRLLRARDTIDRYFAEPLDIPRLAGVALMSPAHFIREFRPRSVSRRTATSSAGASSERWPYCATPHRASRRSAWRWGSPAPGPSAGRSRRWLAGRRRRTERPPGRIVRSWTRPASFGAVTAGSSSFGETTASTRI